LRELQAETNASTRGSYQVIDNSRAANEPSREPQSKRFRDWAPGDSGGLGIGERVCNEYLEETPGTMNRVRGREIRTPSPMDMTSCPCLLLGWEVARPSDFLSSGYEPFGPNTLVLANN
jgi:hypothetical protein